jgi:hypothetical protein
MTPPIGLESYVAPPPAGLALSLLLVAGCYGIGAWTGRHVFRVGIDTDSPWTRFQFPVIGATVLTVFLYPAALLGLTSQTTLTAVAIGLCVIGFGHLYFAPRLLKAGIDVLDIAWKAAPAAARADFVLAAVLLSGLALIAAGPVTNADSLDYHIGIPLVILREGGMPILPEWFHGRLAGSGEVLLSVGLAVGADAFGSLIQVAALVGVVALLHGFATYERGAQPASTRACLVLLGAVSAPVLLFLASAPKPQLLPQAMTTLALALVVAPSRHGLDRRTALLGFSLVCLLTMGAAQLKLSFLMTGGIVGLVALARILSARHFAAIPIAIIMALCVMLPAVVWKMHHYEAGFAAALIEPLAGVWPGSDRFVSGLRTYVDTSTPFPLSLILPASPGSLTTILGIGPFLILWIVPRRDSSTWLLLGAAFAAALLGASLGQRTSRFFVEPYLWVLMAVALAPQLRSELEPARWGLRLQAGATAALCWIGVATLFPGALTPGWRATVMAKSADGYSLMRWVDEVAPPQAVILSGHRSVALSPRRAVSVDWMDYVASDRDMKPYLELLRVRGVTHFLYLEPTDTATLSDQFGPGNVLAKCLGQKVAGPFEVYRATRNPMNRSHRASAFLVRFDAERLPDCALADP